MDNLNKTLSNIIKILGIHFLFFAIVGYFLRNAGILVSVFGSATYKIYFIGLVFGFAFSILKIFLLKKTLTTSLTMSKNKATLYANSQYFLRFILSAVMLYVSIYNPNIDFLASIIGLLSLQSASYLSGFLIKDDPSLKLDDDVVE